MAHSSEVLDVQGSFKAYLDMMFKGMPISPLQRNELQKAYFAGAFWLLILTRDYVANLTEEEGVKFLEGLYDQFLAFALQLPNNGQEPHLTEEPIQSSNLS